MMERSFFIVVLLFISIWHCHGSVDKDSILLENRIGDIMGQADQDLDYSFLQMSLLRSKVEKENSNFFKAMVYNCLGDLYADKGMIDSALLYNEKAINLRLLIDQKEYLASSYESFADLHFLIGEFNTALIYYKKSQAIKEQLNVPLYLKSLYNALGKNYLSLEQYDSSIYYHEKAFDIFYSQSDTQGIASTMNNWGNALYMNDEEQLAIEKYHYSIRYYESCGRFAESIGPIINLGEVFLYLEEYDSALFYNRKALKRSKEIKDNYFYLHYLNLANCYKEFGMQDSAISMLEFYISKSDSIFSIEKTQAILETDAKFQTKEKEQQLILEQEKSEKLAAQDANNQKTIFILFSILSLVVLIILFLARNVRQKLKVSSLELNVQNHKIDNLLKDQEAKSFASMLEGQNAERVRIAQDLHDHLGGTLAAVKVHFSLVDQKITDLQSENRELFNKVNDMLTDAVLDVRRISHDLATGKLSKLGLRGAISDLMDVLSQTKKLQVDFYMDENLPPFVAKKEHEIYALIQEMISNTLKHANAKAIDLQLNRQNELCVIMFEDDGVGFDYNSSKIKGLGLTGLANRVERLNGKLTIDSHIGRGTIIIIELPL